jgi:hypothetical protein
MGMWNWNATREEVMGVYDRTSRLMDHVRAVTPDAAYLVRSRSRSPLLPVFFFCVSGFGRDRTDGTVGFVQNEADVYEPNHEVSFWGDHYPELATIKMK